MIFTKEQLETLMATFQERASYNDIKRAEVSLFAFAKHVQCIPLCVQILQDSNSKNHIMASKFLKDKIQYDFYSLSQQHIQVLYNTLQALISRPYTKPVRFNFSLCFIFIYMRLYKSIGPLLTFLKTNFTNISFLFLVLSEFPIQLKNQCLVIDDSERENLINYAIELQPVVLNQLRQFQSNWSELNQQNKQIVLNCFREWVQLKFNAEVFESLVEHFLFKQCFMLVDDEMLEEVSSNIIESVLNRIGGQSSNVSKVPKLIRLIAEQCVKLFAPINKKLTDQPNQHHPQIDILVAFGTAIIPQFIKQPESLAINFLNELTALLFKTQSEAILQFWKKFLKTLKKSPQVVRSKFTDCLKRLTVALANQVRLPVQFIQMLNELEQDLVVKMKSSFQLKNQLRTLAAKCLKLINYILDDEHVEQLLKNCFQCLRTPLSLQSTQKLQAVLFTVSPLSVFVKSESSVLLIALREVLKLRSESVALNLSILNFIGKASQFIYLFEKQTMLAYKFIGQCIRRPLLRKEASNAFKAICSLNRKVVQTHILEFIALIDLQDPQIELLKALSAAVSNCQNPEFVINGLKTLCLPFVNKIDGYLSNPAIYIQKKLIQNLVALSCIIKSVRQDRQNSLILKSIFTEVWSRIKPLMMNSRNVDLVEQCCIVVKQSMRALKGQFLDYYQQVFEWVSNCFNVTPYSSFVYLVEVFITVFGHNENYYPIIKNIYQHFFQAFYNLTEKDQETDIFLLADFFGMNLRCLRFCQDVFFMSTKFDLILKLILKFMTTQQRQTAYSIFQTATQLYVKYTPAEFIREYNQSYRRAEKLVESADPSKAYYHSLRTYLAGFINPLFTKLLLELRDVPSQTIRDYIYSLAQTVSSAFSQETAIALLAILPNIPTQILVPSEKERAVAEVRAGRGCRKLFELIGQRYLHNYLRFSA